METTRTLMTAAAIAATALWCPAQNGTDSFDPAAHSTFTTTRADGRYVSSRAIAHRIMDANPPRLRFRPDMTAEEFGEWRKDVSDAMARLMKHPAVAERPDPVKTGEEQRDGYRLERWEAYPVEDAAVPYLVLIPDGVSRENPVPGILCIPGSGQTKELLAGESDVNRNSMGLIYVREGYVAVVVDNPACGEPGDLEAASGAGGTDYVTAARALLELDWSYLGYASFVDKTVLDWMKGCQEIRRDRIVVSGFSLGTEPLMALGAMDDSIYAFVYNDFLCSTRERALSMTLPDGRGRRPWPNDISHLIPGFLTEFDFPDIVASLAPRPVICTEGGLDRDFATLSKAYEIAGAPDALECHHYAKFADPMVREQIEEMPRGIDRTTFFRLANVDPPSHYFKSEHVLPWLKKILE